jgi:hypothetical protein
VLLAQGGDGRTSMELLGHSAIVVTMNIYKHVRIDLLRSAVDRMNDVLGDDERRGDSRRLPSKPSSTTRRGL